MAESKSAALPLGDAPIRRPDTIYRAATQDPFLVLFFVLFLGPSFDPFPAALRAPSIKPLLCGGRALSGGGAVRLDCSAVLQGHRCASVGLVKLTEGSATIE
jgi:hypothetical protein